MAPLFINNYREGPCRTCPMVERETNDGATLAGAQVDRRGGEGARGIAN